MRVIGGSLKSRKIQFPKSKLTRPMTDRTKETLFNILGGLVDGKHVLDLYAGSGSLGIEALSRGAMDVTFVDKADWAVRVIEKNLAELELEECCEVMQGEVLRSIDRLKRKGRKYSLIFVDPPFQKGLVKKTLLKLQHSDIVSPFAQIVVGHTKHEPLPVEDLTSFNLTRTKRIGQAYLSFLFKVDSKHGETKSYLSGEF